MGTDQMEIRADVREVVKGVTALVDRQEFVRRANSGEDLDDVWQTMAELGLLGVGLPEEYGGSGAGMTGPVALVEAMSEAGTPPVLYLLTAFARMAILRHGTEEQKRRFLTTTTTGEVRLAFAITEADAGTNSFRMQTFAREDGGHYALSGEKVFISAADQATHVMVVARTTRLKDTEDKRVGLSLFVVPIDSPGLQLTRMKIDLHSPEHQFVLSLDEVGVPAENLIGQRDEGLRALFDALNPERLLVSAWAIGLGTHALQRGVDYARERAPFGTPIGSYQGVQHPLARARAHLDAARLMMYTACDAYDSGDDAGANANMAKLLASEAANAAADAVIQAFGGSAFDQDSDIVTLWPMIRLLRIAPVNNEMILNYISEKILRLPKSY
ncbi:MAG TPA: acyl-CoA dehydrogenase family protein [Ilumatobacteraceae bacterium]|nr:acyl-CoA dehydrogenase family protein [Ilumatobacteraceae bacterium]